MSEFYTHGGWSFTREHDGSVTIRRSIGNRANGYKTVEYHTLTANAWASVVASMSLRGENSATFDEARTFHGKPNP